MTSWITSTVRLNINPDTQMRKPLFILRKITGRINPKGRKPITFPNMLENTANNYLKQNKEIVLHSMLTDSQKKKILYK